jgi:hypothetical protein
MIRGERLLKGWLRFMGCLTGLAVVAVFMPSGWMGVYAAFAGLGRLPEAPIFEYLARSLSAFYAMMGGLFWLASFDVRRYSGLITYMAVAGLLFAAAVLLIDLRAGMPPRWTACEAPSVLISSLVTLVLQARVRRAQAA